VTLSDGRAKRYPVALPVRYRVSGSDICYAGSTENMSLSGLLFTSPVMLDVGSSVEVWVQMPEVSDGGNRSMLYCRGPVVRLGWSNDLRPAAAIRIARFRLLPSTPDFTTQINTAPEEHA